MAIWDYEGMADLEITEYTDAACPWAWSAEPHRLRLQWLYGDALEIRTRMVGLSASAEDYTSKGFTPERLAAAMAQIAADHGMPIDTAVRDRMFATLPACRAVVAVRVHQPESAGAVLRRLRVRHFAGDQLDEPSTVAGAAREAGVDPDALTTWITEDEVERVLQADLAEARDPRPEALALDHKLAGWEGGRRYTCPSYEFRRTEDDARLSTPGFQPLLAYEVAVANLLPHAERREDPSSVEEALAWAGEPLASQEVAVLCSISRDAARQQLSRVAEEQPLGSDGLWTLA